jgi:hypothetical protein
VVHSSVLDDCPVPELGMGVGKRSATFNTWTYFRRTVRPGGRQVTPNLRQVWDATVLSSVHRSVARGRDRRRAIRAQTAADHQIDDDRDMKAA